MIENSWTLPCLHCAVRQNNNYESADEAGLANILTNWWMMSRKYIVFVEFNFLYSGGRSIMLGPNIFSDAGAEGTGSKNHPLLLCPLQTSVCCEILMLILHFARLIGTKHFQNPSEMVPNTNDNVREGKHQ